MSRKIICAVMLLVCGITGVWCEEVSEKQALQLAQQFVNSHNTRKSAPTVAAAGQVSGLYLFNVSNGGGFVVVSNDDATITPILGYGERGSIDIKNLPDNMRAWLQDYANEIAWMQTHGSTKPASKASRRAGSHAQTAIAPLLTTTWDQGAPYNNLCPDGCVTGCVATAMAQVMFYTETVTHQNATTTTTAEIPGYTTNKNYTLDAIPAGTSINWSNMTPTYGNSSTEAQEQAVAELMKYCGYAVKMNYGPSSGAYTYDIVPALKNYFGYAETVTYLMRSFYTYADWTDLIYHELSQGRPVLYAGQSSDSGHEFVCDGYKYEDGNDLFHINWGWGGTSDGYFVLSALNPDEQGIGGSSSTDGYHYGQEAVVGIQKTGDKGTVLDVPANVPNLTFNSITLSHSTIALGESVDITINVTNNSKVVYDGDLWLSGINGGKVFVIPAGTTQDCVITITPATAETYTVQAQYPTGATTEVTSTCSATLTVKNQTPTGLAASDIRETSATISWTNVGDASKWNVRSVPVAVTTEDFNDTAVDWLLDAWTKVDGEDYVKTTDVNGLQWLITPMITFGGLFSFDVWKSGTAEESFSVLYSWNRKTFYLLMRDVAPTDSRTKYTVDLSSLSGDGWIAIIHTFEAEGSYVCVDDVTIAEPVDAWTKVSGVSTPSCELTGLSAVPRYAVQVQAVNSNGGKWSTPLVFSTTNKELLLADNDSGATIKDSELIDSWDGVTAKATLSGRTLYHDNAWNTLCLPFDVTDGDDTDEVSFTGTPLVGATVMELDTRTDVYTHATGVEDGVLYLNFKPVTSIVAGTPYIIKWPADEQHITSPEFSDVVISKEFHSVVSADNKVAFLGTYDRLTFDDTDDSILFLGEGNTLYYPQPDLSDPVSPKYPSINPFRAFFKLHDLSAAAIPANNVKMFFGDEGPTLVAIPSWKEVAGAWYTVDGRRVNGKPAHKGVYVVNGRKVVIK